MEIVSCAEDGSVLVWRDGELIQSLRHPCCVWAVKPLNGESFYLVLFCILSSKISFTMYMACSGTIVELFAFSFFVSCFMDFSFSFLLVPTGGDFLTCGDDGFLRIFSRDPLKTSSTQVAQLNQEFQLEVDEAQRKRHKGPSAEEIAKAPKWEHRGNTPGRSADQVMVFNKDGEIIAAQWISGSWVIVGTVTGSGDGGYVKEVWYDHVMPVEIEGPNGVMALKLGHNNGENPFVAAQRFIDQNDMSQSYLNQIADWITARSGQTQPTLGGGGGAQSSTRNASTASSSSAASTVPVAAPSVFTFKVVSLTTFDDVPPMAKLLSKVTEFSNAQTDPSWAVDVGHLEALGKVLSETSYYHSSRLSVPQLQALLGPVLQWDEAQLFPLFDVLRVVAIHPGGAETLVSTELKARLLNVFHRALTLIGSAEGEIAFATVLTASRFVCNAVKMETLRSVCYSSTQVTPILQSLSKQTRNSNKLVRAAASRIVLNVSGFASSTGVFASTVLSAEAVSMMVEVIGAFLTHEKESIEVVFNALRALGTLEIHNQLTSLPGVRENMPLLLSTVKTQWSAAQLGELPTACLAELVVLFAK